MNSEHDTPKLMWSTEPADEQPPSQELHEAPLLLPPPGGDPERQSYAELVAFLRGADEEGTSVSLLTVDEYMDEYAPGTTPKEE